MKYVKQLLAGFLTDLTLPSPPGIRVTINSRVDRINIVLLL